MTVDEIISAVIVREGGYVHNPADRGGPTKYGITQATLAAWYGHAVSADEVEALSETTARQIYTKLYVYAPRFHELPFPLDMVTVDAGVHHGQRAAARMLQRALGVTVDGVVGSETLAAANLVDARRLAVRTCAERVRFFGRLITDNLTDADRDGVPDNTEFAEGWLARVADLLDDAVES